MDRKRGIFLIALLILLLFAINYRFVNNAVVEFLDEKEIVNVERVIDGDTIVVENNTHVRLLGINTPEKGERYYSEAKIFLESLILNKTIELKYGKDRYDKYKRTLAFIFSEGRNINIEIIKNGFANAYILDDKLHSNELRNAWEECIKNGKNLCERSDDKCAECVELKEFYFKIQDAVFYNKCNFDCSLAGWNIKDEGRKKFSFGNFVLENNKEVKISVGNGTDSKEILFWKGEDYVWTSTGDTLFLRDEKGKLVLWKNY